MSGTPHHPIEEWSDAELLDQLVFLRGELADQPQMLDDAETDPLASIEEEIARRGLSEPGGSDPHMPAREDHPPSRPDR